MKEGRVSLLLRADSFLLSGRDLEHRSPLYGAVALCGDQLVGSAPVVQFLSGPSCGHGGWGACRSKGTVVGEHVPDRLAKAAADLDRGDLGAAGAAVAGAHSLHDRAV